MVAVAARGSMAARREDRARRCSGFAVSGPPVPLPLAGTLTGERGEKAKLPFPTSDGGSGREEEAGSPSKAQRGTPPVLPPQCHPACRSGSMLRRFGSGGKDSFPVEAVPRASLGSPGMARASASVPPPVAVPLSSGRLSSTRDERAYEAQRRDSNTSDGGNVHLTVAGQGASHSIA
jgi:hypothetical protein